ncbi:hypothetical protein [Asticcacaulis sp. AC402]|uniref:hypothetical protein n=1 Tax=Asticcacaulis sp. AC402 TaxID=1282361 RepID=UPI0003C3F2BB|nr:hypothetical protein [Asticcacaulis sp. AC402]ESQ75649.1 hypothetical protein ABAC402_08980 [Asticcacaulis sp. AC402]
MNGQFCFFTDPALLNAQNASQGFGYTDFDGTRDRFRTTDAHTVSADAPVYAFCKGQICAQKDDGGTLSLILKPEPPGPANFPAIRYIIYKGVDPASLLTADGKNVNTALAGNDLIKAAGKIWKTPRNNNDKTQLPLSKLLGLHLDATFPVRPERFDGQAPLDNLFYGADPDVQLPTVEGKDILGRFKANTPCGIDMVVDRMVFPARIEAARMRDYYIKADPLPSTTDPADYGSFKSWHDREACLTFIDPCALWGSFFNPKATSSSNLYALKNGLLCPAKGPEIYSNILKGASGAGFANRNRVWLDIRNGHGYSVNYYKEAGRNIQFTFDPNVSLAPYIADTSLLRAASMIDYYASGWPICSINTSVPPAGVDGDQVHPRFGLPNTANTRPLIYLSKARRDISRTLNDSERFLECPAGPDPGFLDEVKIAWPLVADGTAKMLVAGYNKLCHFKRPMPGEAPAASGLEPVYAGALSYAFPAFDSTVFPPVTAPTLVRIFDEDLLVSWSTKDFDAVIARPGIARDELNIYLFLAPMVYYDYETVQSEVGRGKAYKAKTRTPAQHLILPGFSSKTLPGFIGDFLPPKLEQVAVKRKFNPAATTLTPTGMTGIDVGYFPSNDTLFILAFTRAEYEAGFSPAALTARNTLCLPFISLPGSQERHKALDDKKGYYESGPVVSFIGKTGTIVSRQNDPNLPTVYAHADL